MADESCREAFVLRALKNTPEMQRCTECICYWAAVSIKKAVYCLSIMIIYSLQYVGA